MEPNPISIIFVSDTTEYRANDNRELFLSS
jgi:hypothetical protein